MSDSHENRRAEPIINLPTPIVAVGVFMAGVHAAQVFIVPASANAHIIWWFSFIPVRLSQFSAEYIQTLVSYSLLHGSWGHLANNSLWLVAFGSPVAAALGNARFALFWVICSVAAALVHLGADPSSMVPMIGASGAVSGMMGAAARAGFRLRANRTIDDEPIVLPSLALVLRNRSVIAFLCLYLAVNVGIGLSDTVAPGIASIAWQAHIGGLIAGFLLFPLMLRHR
ncbi:MAG: rhomboid family intramembrane serine protease [Rhizobiaceae bacterium]